MTELLTKLSPHATLPNGEPPGGIPEITAEDVIRACAGLNRQAYLYGLVRFAGYCDPPTIAGLKKETYHTVAHMSRIKRWGTPPDTIRSISTLVLQLLLVPRMCGRCKGAGLHNNQVECKWCRGTGLGPKMTREESAEAIGVTAAEWMDKYSRVVNDVLVELSCLDDYVSKHIRRRVYRG